MNSINKIKKQIAISLSFVAIGCGQADDKNVTDSKLLDTIDETINFINEWEEKDTTNSPQVENINRVSKINYEKSAKSEQKDTLDTKKGLVSINLQNDTQQSVVAPIDPDTISDEKKAIETINKTNDLNVLSSILKKYPQDEYPEMIKRVRFRIQTIIKLKEELVNGRCLNEYPYSVIMKILKKRPEFINFLNEETFKKIYITEPIVVQNHLKKHINNTKFLSLIEGKPLGQSIICCTMNEHQVKERITSFLSDLRENGQLLSMHEFGQHLKSLNIKYEEYQNLPPRYYYKGMGFDRLLGARYIEETARSLKLHSIKVPKKIAVIETGKEDLFNINFGQYLVCSSNDIHVYAESIEPLERKATRTEIKEFFEIVQATGFRDYLGYNFILGKNQIGEEGIYFIDTEKENFSYFPIHNSNDQFVKTISRIINEKDYLWANILLSEYQYNDINIGKRYISNNNLRNQACLRNLLKTFPNQAITTTERTKKTQIISLPKIEIEYSSDEENEDGGDFGVEEYSFSIKKLSE